MLPVERLNRTINRTMRHDQLWSLVGPNTLPKNTLVFVICLFCRWEYANAPTVL